MTGKCDSLMQYLPNKEDFTQIVYNIIYDYANFLLVIFEILPNFHKNKSSKFISRDKNMLKILTKHSIKTE